MLDKIIEFLKSVPATIVGGVSLLASLLLPMVLGEDLPMWQYQVSSDLRSADFTEWLEGVPADSQITYSDFGMKFVG